MKSVKFLFFASVCSAVMTAAFQSEAVNLPDGYTEVAYVTIPLGSAARNGVATAVAWPDVKKAYVKYATTDTVPSNFMILGGIKDGSQKSPASQWIALINSGGQDSGMRSTGFSSVSAERTPGDTYARDGSVHEITFTCSTATANLVFFGGCWSDHSWSGVADWYSVKLYGSGEALIASFVPCTHDGVAGFYDTVSQSFLTKQFADWPDFVAGAAVTNYPITISGSPDMFGTVSPAYGSGTVEKGVSVPLALTGGQDDNGVTYITTPLKIRAYNSLTALFPWMNTVL